MSGHVENANGKKRAAFFLPNLGGGGAERVALAIINNLVRRGHEVDLVLVQATGELLPLLPPEVNVVDLQARRFAGSLLPLARYLRTRKPDTFHAVMWPITVIAVAAHRLARSRARLVVSDQVALSKHVAPRKLPLLRATVRLFYPMADIRIVCSAESADDLAQVSGLGRDRFEVIFNPIEPPDAIDMPPDMDSRWGGRGPRILNAGRFIEQKNQALLIQAFALLRREREATLMILGDGPLRPMLEELAADLGVAGDVIMPGFAIDPWPYYKSADLFVLSSDYEGFPLVLAEAMRAGTRVVSTDCPTGPGEMLDGGRYGRLVPCGDAAALAQAMAAALDDTSDLQPAIDRAEAMSGARNIERYSELMLSGA